jgi:serine protease inhibitor
MIDSIPPYTMMYLLNAIYFKGDWAHRFAEDKTRDEEFTDSLTKGALKG